MMKVTNKTFGMIASNRAKAHQQFVMVQRQRKDGSWGMPMMSAKLFLGETDQDVVDRLSEFNCAKYRLAE